MQFISYQTVKSVQSNGASSADIAPRQVAMLDFAMKVAVEPYLVGEADFAALRAAGFTDEDAWDIGAIAALFALSNRMAYLTRIRPNEEFYVLGRVPKQPRLPK